jgi:hypothetical protein
VVYLYNMMTRTQREARQQRLNRLEGFLYGTKWGKHFARPAQIRAGAKKLLDVLTAQARRSA